MTRRPDGGLKAVITFLLLIGLSICGFWATQISNAFRYLNLPATTDGAYLTWHIIAEFLTGAFALLAAYLMLINHPFGKRLALMVSGMLMYTGLNSIGLGANRDIGLLILAMLSSLGAFFSFLYLLFRREL